MNQLEKELEEEVDDLVRRTLDALPVPLLVQRMVKNKIGDFVKRIVTISCKYTRGVAQEEAHRAIKRRNASA